jgi:hypothetical protein
MPFDVINTGTTANDGTGDPLRTAFTKTNTNFALAVEGATGSTPNNVPVFDGTTGKLVKDSGVSIATLTGGLNFAGLWNASTNTPTLTSSVGTEGTYYLVSVAGSTTLNGVSSWAVGDSVLFTGGVWVKLANNFVSNAGASTNNAVAVFDGTTGKLVKDGGTGVTASVGKFAPTGNITAGNGMYLPTTNTVAFSTASVERLRIDLSGNVGINRTSPSAPLTIQTTTGAQTIRLVGRTAQNRSFLRFYDTTDATQYAVLDSKDTEFDINVTENLPLRLLTNNVERMRINAAGNVGIGTTSPTVALDVNANTVRVRTARTPASAGATGAVGEICWDADYIYVCTATNTWKRVAIATW